MFRGGGPWNPDSRLRRTGGVFGIGGIVEVIVVCSLPCSWASKVFVMADTSWVHCRILSLEEPLVSWLVYVCWQDRDGSGFDLSGWSSRWPKQACS